VQKAADTKLEAAQDMLMISRVTRVTTRCGLMPVWTILGKASRRL